MWQFSGCLLWILLIRREAERELASSIRVPSSSLSCVEGGWRWEVEAGGWGSLSDVWNRILRSRGRLRQWSIMIMRREFVRWWQRTKPFAERLRFLWEEEGLDAAWGSFFFRGHPPWRYHDGAVLRGLIAIIELETLSSNTSVAWLPFIITILYPYKMSYLLTDVWVLVKENLEVLHKNFLHIDKT